MRRSAVAKQRASLRGWWKGLPLLVMPFSMIFGEAWLRTQILNNDYEVNALNQRIRALEGRLESLRDEQVHLVRMERITEKAPDLGLVEPDPGQIVVLVAGERGKERTHDSAPREKLPVTAAPPVLAQHLELLPEERAAALALAEPPEVLRREVPAEELYAEPMLPKKTPLLDAVDPDALPEAYGE